MSVVFSAWDYHVTYLELTASVLALVAVGLATRGTRWAWPFYFLSAALYAWLFVEFDLLASALLQGIFVVAAVWGWFSWRSAGVTESKVLARNFRVVLVCSCIVAWLALTPVLNAVGAAATLLDAFVLVGSVIAQVLMVRGYVEAWPAWVVVNIVGTYHYATQQLYFTSLLYFILLLMGVWGWLEWSRRTPRPEQLVASGTAIRVEG